MKIYNVTMLYTNINYWPIISISLISIIYFFFLEIFMCIKDHIILPQFWMYVIRYGIWGCVLLSCVKTWKGVKFHSPEEYIFQFILNVEPTVPWWFCSRMGSFILYIELVVENIVLHFDKCFWFQYHGRTEFWVIQGC